MTTVVRSSRHDARLVLTIDRPERRNALNADVIRALQEALDRARSDDTIRAVVLTGAGGDFCAGGDVKGMGEGGSRTPEQRRAGMARYRDLALALHGLDKPLIAAIDGVAFGAGLSMALYADLVLVSTRARMAMVFHRIGLVPDVGARAEVAARAGEHDGAHFGVGAQLAQRGGQRVGGRRVDGVLGQGPVEREDGDAAFALQQDAVAVGRHVTG